MGKYRNSCITVKTKCEKKNGLDVTVLIFLDLFVMCFEELFLEISVWDLLEDV
jgi:hypothetical protein